MDIHEYLGVLRRGIVLVVLGALIGVAGGYAVLSTQQPTYSSTSRELLTNRTPGDLSISSSRIASYVLVASSGLVLQPVIDELGLDTSVEQLASRVSVVTPPQTVIIEITATASTPEEAQQIATTISAVFGEVVADQLETTTGVTPSGAATPTPGATAAPAPTPSPTTTRLPDGTIVAVTPVTAPVRVVNLESAPLPTAPDPTSGPLVLLVGGVLGLAAGLLLASLREAFDRRVRTARDAGRVTDVPVLGDIPADRGLRANPFVARSGSRSAGAEAFRALRTHLDHVRGRDGAETFVVTATQPRHGATTVAANLAVALANTGTSVALVDADLRSPSLSRLFGIQTAAGLTDVLAGRADLDGALRSGVTGGLAVLPAGTPSSNPGELLATPAMRDLLAELRRRYEVVLIDSPSIAAVTDAAVLASFDASTLLVAGKGRVTRPRLEAALGLLAAGGSVPVGLVLTRIPRLRLPARAGRPSPAEAITRDVAVARRITRDAVRAGAGEPVSAGAAAAAAAVPAVPAVPAAPVRSTLAPQLELTAEPSVPRALRQQQSQVLPQAAPEIAPVADAPAAVAPEIPAAPPVGPPTAPASAPAASAPSSSLFDPPLPPELELRIAGRELPIGRPRTPAPDVEAATALDSAFAALPTATADEQRAGIAAGEQAPAAAPAPADRPAPRLHDTTSSRFAPDPAKYTPDPSVYAIARPPQPGTQGRVPVPPMSGTVVTTITTSKKRELLGAAGVDAEGAVPPPPIEHVLPVGAAPVGAGQAGAGQADAGQADTAAPADEREPLPVWATQPRPPRPLGTSGRHRDDIPRRPRAVPPVADLAGLDDTTVPPERLAALRDDRTPAVGSLLGEIGGLPRVEVRATRPIPITDPVTTPEVRARESYELRSRELERAAQERLLRERQRLELSIREQLAHDKRELESVLDNRLDDTVLRPSHFGPVPPVPPVPPASRAGARDDDLDGPADD